MKPEFRSSNSEFWLIFKNLNYNAKNIGNDLSAGNAGKKMPIKSADKKVLKKTEQQLEKILQYLSECSCKDICMLLDVKERRARQLLQELQEQKKTESYGANGIRRYRLLKKIAVDKNRR